MRLREQGGLRLRGGAVGNTSRRGRLISNPLCSAILELEFEARSPSIGCCRPLVSDFSILGFGLFVCFFFWRIRGFATICNLLGLLYLFFFSLNWVCFTIYCLGLMLGFFSLVGLLCYNFFFLQILVQFIIIIIFAWK